MTHRHACVRGMKGLDEEHEFCKCECGAMSPNSHGDSDWVGGIPETEEPDVSDDVKPYTREELAHLEWRFIEAQRSVDLVDLNIDEKEVARLLATARAGLADRERLDFLIDWLGHHDDLEGAGIRDWNDNADARAAIDKGMQRSKLGERAAPDGGSDA